MAVGGERSLQKKKKTKLVLPQPVSSAARDGGSCLGLGLGMGGGGWHDAMGVIISSAAGGAYWPIAIRCPSLGPFVIIDLLDYPFHRLYRVMPVVIVLRVEQYVARHHRLFVIGQLHVVPATHRPVLAVGELQVLPP